MTLVEELYCEVGKALHKAQIVEYNIVSAHLLLSKTDPASFYGSKEENWSRKTLGKLLRPLTQSGLLPEDGKLFLETLVAARNHLAHSFFVSLTEVHTKEGVEKLLREVEAMKNVFERAHLLFEQVLTELAKPFDIDFNIIKEEARNIVLNHHSEEEG